MELREKHLYLNCNMWGPLNLILFIYFKTKFRGVVALRVHPMWEDLGGVSEKRNKKA